MTESLHCLLCGTDLFHFDGDPEPEHDCKQVQIDRLTARLDALTSDCLSLKDQLAKHGHHAGAYVGLP